MSSLIGEDGKCFFDAHCHLCAPEFENDIDSVIREAQKTGVRGALVVAENSGEFQRILHLAKQYPDYVLPCLGVHPVQGDPKGEQRSATVQDLEAAQSMIEENHEALGAIGEVGLDFTPRFCKTDEDKSSQRLVLTKQVQLAQKYDLPVNVHSRSAGRPTIALLKELGATKVLLHAFDGKPSVAMEGVKEGFYFSIPPSIVRSDQKKKLVSQLPLEQMLLETDAPALGPEKQVRNVPANIVVACEYIAQIKKVDPSVVWKVTSENALKLFPKLSRFLVK